MGGYGAFKRRAITRVNMKKKETHKGIPPEKLAETIGETALTKKAEDVVILDIRGITSIADFFVIASGASDTHIKSITEEIVRTLKGEGIHVWHIEGTAGARWILLDYVDIVVHIFHHEARMFYQLEKLWGDAPMKRVE